MTLSLATPTDVVREREPAAARLRTVWQEHRVAIVVVTLGVLLRVIVLIAYPRGFWIQGDSQEYLGTAFSYHPGYTRPSGYALFLMLLVPFGTTLSVLVVQHLCGIALAVTSYVFLYRRGVHPVIAGLAIAPMVLKARVVVLEHYLLAETFFTLTLTVAIMLLLWRDKPGVRRCAAVGLLFGIAAVTRSVAMAVLAAPVLYLIIRRLGWRQLLALVAPVVLVLGGYMTWYHAGQGQFALSGYSGRFLWARTTTFMDCSKLDLTPAEVPICPTEPLGQRPNPGFYLWAKTSVHKYTTDEGDKISQGLAVKAITHQPGAYLALIGEGTWALMLPGIPAGSIPCDYHSNQFPLGGAQPCLTKLAPVDLYTRHYVGDSTSLSGPLLAPLNWYSRVFVLPGSVSALAFLFALVMTFVRTRRRSSLRDRLDPLLLTGISFGMIVLSVATASPDTRYEAPSLPLAMLGAALALSRLLPRDPAPVSAPEPEPASAAPRPASG